MWGLISVLLMVVCILCSNLWRKTNNNCYAIGMIGSVIAQFVILIVQVVLLLA